MERRRRRRCTCEFIAFSFHHTSQLDKFGLALLLDFRVVKVLVAERLHIVQGECKFSGGERKKTRGKNRDGSWTREEEVEGTGCTEVNCNNFC